MTVTFERPVGAAADLAELEYVSALHQTQSGHVRTDGSIRDVDIQLFIRSRYGLEVDLETVRTTILYGLGGDFEAAADGEKDDDDDNAGHNNNERADAASPGWSLCCRGKKADDDDDDDDDDADGIDLAEMVAILLIPTLIKSARRDHSRSDGSPKAGGSHDDDTPAADDPTDPQYAALRERRKLLKSLRPDRGLIKDVFKMVMSEATGGSSCKPRALTPSLMRSMLTAFGESDLAENDALVEEMVRAATASGQGGGLDGGDAPPLFDADAFARGLTSDVLLLDVENEAKLSSNYDDVLTAEEAVSSSASSAHGGGNFDDEEIVQPGAPGIVKGGNTGREANPSSEEKLKLAFNASAIDFVADQYRSKLLVVCLWTGFVLMYFAFREYMNSVVGASVKLGSEYDEQLDYCDSLIQSGSLLEILQFTQCHTEYLDSIANSRGVMQDWNCPEIDGGTNWGCLIGKSVVGWLYTLGSLSLFGLLYIGLGSIGNSVRARRRWPLIFGIIVLAGITFFFAFAFYDQREAWSVEFNETVAFNTTNGTEIYVPFYYYYEEPEAPIHKIVIMIVGLVISGIAILLQLFHALGPLILRCCAVPRRCCSWGHAQVAKFLSPGSVKNETMIKQAAARKLNAMARNAREVHLTSVDTAHGDGDENFSFGQGLVKFSLQEHKVECAGGFLWTWKRIFSGEIYTVEGVWISSRIWAGNLAQFLISLFILALGSVFTRTIVEEWRAGLEGFGLLDTILEWIGVDINGTDIGLAAAGELNETSGMSTILADMVCKETIEQFSGNLTPECFAQLDDDDVCTSWLQGNSRRLQDFSEGMNPESYFMEQVAESAVMAANDAVQQFVKPLYPTDEYMISSPMILATAVAFTSVIILALIYIPSVVSTTLQLRCGLIPFMHDNRNQMMYRTSMDQVTIVLGSMFWGALYSAGFLGALFGGVLFLFLWQVTRERMFGITAGLIGLVITMSLKMIVVWMFLRATVFAAFYRKRPAQGNIVSLILEVANIGYAVGTALARAIKLVLISLLYIGRLDTPLLADGVGVGPLQDTYPTIFRKDIFAHEAHRHPYMEVLGLIYMMKIRYGEKFGNKAGYCYRLIFSVALMPWLRKYRVMARPNLLDDENRDKVDTAGYESSSLLLKSGKFRSSVFSAAATTEASSEEGELAAGLSEVEKLRADNQAILEENEEMRKTNQMMEEENQALRQALKDANIDLTQVKGLQEESAGESE